MIIIEGKREDVANELKKKFELDGPFIDRVLSIDPTRSKYIDYLAKILNHYIKVLAGPKGGLTSYQEQGIESPLSTVIPWFHRNQDKITEDDIWRAETSYRELHGGVIDNIEGISKSPRDINQYGNPAFLETLMNIIDSKKTEREIEREAKSQVTKLYEDNEVLVVQPNSFAASCYYGANTKWCTTQKGSPAYFEKYARDGNLYYFLNKKTGLKLALFVHSEHNTKTVYDAKDNEVGLDTLREEFSEQTDLIDDLIGVGKFIKKVREYSRGLASEREVLNSDDSIYKIIPSKPLGQSELVIEFKDDDEFFKALDLSDDDIWFANLMLGGSSNYEFMDYYSVEDDLKQGYGLYHYFNEENMEKLKQISAVILGTNKFELNSDEFMGKLFQQISKLFENQLDYIISDYVYEKNTEMQKTTEEYIENEIDKVLEKVDFQVYRKYEMVKTTIGNCVWLSSLLKIPKIDAKSLFNQAVSQYTGRIGGWYDNTYEFQNDDNFDSQSFNNTVERRLGEILEIIEEEETPIQDYLDLVNKISSKYEFDKWYDLPKDKSIRFGIKKIDREKMKIIVSVSKDHKQKILALTEEQFFNLLYQPELFDLFGEE